MSGCEILSFDEGTGDLVLQVDSFSNYSTVDDLAQPDRCGLVRDNLTLIDNVSADGTCFTVLASDVTIDCAGHKVNYSESDDGYAFNITGFDDVVIKDCVIKNKGSSFVDAIYLADSNGSIIQNNSLVETLEKTGIYNTMSDYTQILDNTVSAANGGDIGLLVEDSLGLTISGNTIYGDTTGIELQFFYDSTVEANDLSIGNSQDKILMNTCNGNDITDNIVTNDADGIHLTSSEENTISGNEMTITGMLAYALRVTSNSDTNTIEDNVIISEGDQSPGILIDDSDGNILDSNDIVTEDPLSYCIELVADSVNNTLRSNNLSAPAAYEIEDTTDIGTENVLIYTNGYGIISWTDADFREDLSLNGTIALGTNLYIGDNVAAVNTSAFQDGLIDSSADITLYDLDFNSVTKVYTTDEYLLTSAAVEANGTDCLSVTCTKISYAGSNLLFNTTQLSSFSADGTSGGNGGGSGSSGGGDDDGLETTSPAKNEWGKVLKGEVLTGSI
jgi:parallel beta-helix repeat protein